MYQKSREVFSFGPVENGMKMLTPKGKRQEAQPVTCNNVAPDTVFGMTQKRRHYWAKVDRLHTGNHNWISAIINGPRATMHKKILIQAQWCCTHSIRIRL